MPVEEQLWEMPGVPVCSEWNGSQAPVYDSRCPARASLAEVAGQSCWSAYPRQGGIMGADGCRPDPVRGYGRDGASTTGRAQWEDRRAGHLPKPDQLGLAVRRNIPPRQYSGEESLWDLSPWRFLRPQGAKP